MDLRKMSVGQKLARLSETNKKYILGYIDRALYGFPGPAAKKNRPGKITAAGRSGPA